MSQTSIKGLANLRARIAECVSGKFMPHSSYAGFAIAGYMYRVAHTRHKHYFEIIIRVLND